MPNEICLTIAHNIFLTRELRYEIAAGNSVEVVGVSVPVWHDKDQTDEPAEEIFCRYLITSQEMPPKVSWLDNDGYTIALQTKMCNRLRDISDEGSECVMFTNHNMMEIAGRHHKAIHYVSIHDIEVLESSLA